MQGALPCSVLAQRVLVVYFCKEIMLCQLCDRLVIWAHSDPACGRIECNIVLRCTRSTLITVPSSTLDGMLKFYFWLYMWVLIYRAAGSPLGGKLGG